MFRSFRHSNFRFFFLGQTVSLVGTWMQIMAVSWLAYRLTNSPFLLGCVAFASQIPTLFLAPVAGVVSDRFDRRKLLLVAQFLSMSQAIILTALVLTKTVTIMHILFLSFFLGIVNAMELTVRQSFLIELVDEKADLANAIALNALMFNVSRLLGPAMAGILIVSFGEGMCFIVNACSYVAVIAGLLCIRTLPRAPNPSGMHLGRELKAGWRYAYGFLPIRMLLLVIALFSVIGAAIHTLLPVFVREVFHGGPKMFGSLLTVSGMGAVVGTAYLARKKSILGFVEKIALAAVVMSTALIIFSTTMLYWVACVAAFFIGLSMMIGIGGGNMILQTLVHDDKRGRVMSLYAVALLGTAPLGSLSAGAFASKFGPGAALAVGSVVCLTGAIIFWSKLKSYHLKARPIYIDKGIISEIQG
ncbi:MAG: MFS transporter [Candidatus Omnitrophica bacterium]|nr:MFS transporter [Candidatus Omnitrophota bacterium]